MFYIGITALYLIIFGLAAHFPRKENYVGDDSKKRFAVLIPGYKEDNVIIDVAKQALKQTYPSELFDVVIIADSFKQETLEQLKQLPIILVEVSFEVSTKSKALNQAMATIGDDYDIALVLDADNVMEFEFLEKIKMAFDSGPNIVQAHRIAKNLNNSMAILDAVSEEINNTIFRSAHRNLGLSASLIGSGMAFDYQLFKSTMKEIDAIGGFDKQLELWFLERRYTIEYMNECYVEDEKVQKAEVFANQRRRWLSAQFIYFGQNIGKAIVKLITKGNVDFFDKVFQFGQLPRVIVLGLSIMISFLYALIYLLPESIQFYFYFNLLHWLALLCVVSLALLLAVPKSFYNAKTLKALLSLPQGFLLMLLSLTRLKGANKRYLHTEHGDPK
jgi:cellulose synthase/poly-beta-1,6-N-acetylglucosamine synthase-like glycosyltransferase